MAHSTLTDEELAEVARACQYIRIDGCTPPYLQDFIAGRLAGSNPLLSLKVRRLGPDGMRELCEHIRDNPAPC
jgi:hypothetical protein